MMNATHETAALSQLYSLRAQIADAYARNDRALLYQLSRTIDEMQLRIWTAAEAL